MENSDPMTIRVYSHTSRSMLSPAVWREMVRELTGARELIMRLIWRDLKGRYQRALLSFFWILAMPLVAVGGFALLKNSGLARLGDTPLPYAVFALTGLTIWQIYSGVILAGSRSLEASGSLISKVNFPRESLVLASLAQPILDFAIRMVLVGLVCAWYGVYPSILGLILFPLALLPLLMLATGMALLMGILNALVHDIGHAVSLVLILGLALTPVMYTPPANSSLAEIAAWNPLTQLVAYPRDLLLSGSLPPLPGVIGLTLLCAVSLALSWGFFHVAEPRVIERLGAR